MYSIGSSTFVKLRAREDGFPCKCKVHFSLLFEDFSACNSTKWRVVHRGRPWTESMKGPHGGLWTRNWPLTTCGLSHLLLYAKLMSWHNQSFKNNDLPRKIFSQFVGRELAKH